MYRSSPVNAAPAAVGEPPAFTASAARYRPTGQPSVRRTSSVEVRVGELDTRLQEQRARLMRIHRQIVDPDLHDAALCT